MGDQDELLAGLYDELVTDALQSISSDSRKRHEPDSIRFPQPTRHRDSPITHTTVPLDPNGAVPLKVHARYTTREIQAAFGDGGSLIPPRWDSGVKWLADSKIDLFAFTLDKSSGDFSLTTSYRDYAISRDLIHWKSQSATSLASPTGQRYVNHEALGSEVVMFARLRADERAFWCLGPATNVRHEGERPIAITWRLEPACPLISSRSSQQQPSRRTSADSGGQFAA